MNVSLDAIKKIKLKDLKKYQYAIIIGIYGSGAIVLFVLSLNYLTKNINNAFDTQQVATTSQFQIDIEKFNKVAKKLNLQGVE